MNEFVIMMLDWTVSKHKFENYNSLHGINNCKTVLQEVNVLRNWLAT